MKRPTGLLILIGLTLPAWALPQEPLPTETTVKAKSTTVLVDVVVHDRKERPVRDLTADDFELLEQGAPQKITFFQTPEETAQTREQPESQKVRSLLPSSLRGHVPSQSLEQTILNPQGDFTALVFSILQSENRVYARKAAIQYASKKSDSTWMGVFQSGRYLEPVQFFTRDSEAVETAIERATGETLMHQEPVEEEMLAIADRVVQELGGGTSVAEGSPGLTSASVHSGNSAGAGGRANLKMLLMQYHMLDTTERMQRQVAGHAQTDALLALINTLRTLPGRKSILYFSEGVEIPQGVEEQFQAVIHAANRAQVSIYTVDVAGLRINSTGREMSREMSRAGVSRKSESVGIPMSGPMTRDILEKREDLIRSDPHKGLLQLAKDTGGIFIRDTNDLAAGLERIDEDQHSYYLLGYSPTDARFDGTYRSIEVRVPSMKDADLQFRRGYYAVDRVFDEAPVLEYELPALSLLQKGPKPKELPVAAAVLSFPKPDEPGRVAILADLPPGSLSYGPESTTGSSDFAFIVVVRDQDGDLERKVSQQYRLSRPADADSPTDGILFYRTMRLAPGDYAVDVVGMDALAGKGGIEHLDVQIPRPDPSLPQLSSLILVKSAEKLNGQSDVPFQAGDLLLYPMLRDRVSRAARPQLDLFFSLYPRGTAPKEAVLELRHYNKVVGKQRLALPAPESEGRVAYTGALPIADLNNGVYTLTVWVPAGDKMIGRSRRFLLTK